MKRPVAVFHQFDIIGEGGSSHSPQVDPGDQNLDGTAPPEPNHNLMTQRWEREIEAKQTKDCPAGQTLTSGIFPPQKRKFDFSRVVTTMEELSSVLSRAFFCTELHHGHSVEQKKSPLYARAECCF